LLIAVGVTIVFSVVGFLATGLIEEGLGSLNKLVNLLVFEGGNFSACSKLIVLLFVGI